MIEKYAEVSDVVSELASQQTELEDAVRDLQCRHDLREQEIQNSLRDLQNTVDDMRTTLWNHGYLFLIGLGGLMLFVGKLSTNKAVTIVGTCCGLFIWGIVLLMYFLPKAKKSKKPESISFRSTAKYPCLQDELLGPKDAQMSICARTVAKDLPQFEKLVKAGFENTWFVSDIDDLGIYNIIVNKDILQYNDVVEVVRCLGFQLKPSAFDVDVSDTIRRGRKLRRMCKDIRKENNIKEPV